MTTRTLSCPLPENINPLSPNGYMFSIEKLPSLSFFCQEVNLPSLNLPEATQLNPFTKIPIAGDQLEFGQLTIQFLVDDVVCYTFTNSSSLPFNQNFFMIFNMAMGGTFGGNVDPAFNSAVMEVDYVRVYQ